MHELIVIELNPPRALRVETLERLGNLLDHDACPDEAVERDSRRGSLWRALVDRLGSYYDITTRVAFVSGKGLCWEGRLTVFREEEVHELRRKIVPNSKYAPSEESRIGGSEVKRTQTASKPCRAPARRWYRTYHGRNDGKHFANP